MCLFFFFFSFQLTSNFLSFISYLTSTATSPYSKMVKSFFHRYFSFSNKVFYPVAYIMNELQHLTTLTGLKFCLALCFSSGPNSSKFGPSCPQVGSQLFSFGERDGDNFFRARANPAIWYGIGDVLTNSGTF